MDFIIEYWYVILAGIAAIAAAGYGIYNFANKPSVEQIQQVKEWLLWAVTEAERVLGNGTGALKLRFVYDAFVTKFPLIAKLVSFSTFSSWVDEVLDIFKSMLQQNVNIKNYVEGEKEEQ